MRIRESISFGGRRKHLAVNFWNGYPSKNHAGRGWCLQWATPTQHGYKYGSPVEFGFRTKADALERRSWIYRARSRAGEGGEDGPVQ